MSRDKSVWFAEEILLDAKLINFQLETGEWDAVEEMLRAEAQLSRDAETGRLRPYVPIIVVSKCVVDFFKIFFNTYGTRVYIHTYLVIYV